MRFGTFESPALGAASFDDLSAKQANEVVARALEEMPSALQRISEDLGEPDPERLETSLRISGEWFLGRLASSYGAETKSRWERFRGSRPGDSNIPPVPVVGGPWHPAWQEVEPDALPYWCWFRSGSGLFGPLGPAVVHDIDALTAYIATLMLRSHPGAIVRRSSGTRSAVDYRQPVVAIGDGREFSLPSRYDVMAIRALNPADPRHEMGVDLDAFVRRLMVWMRPLPAVVDHQSDEQRAVAYSVDPAGPGEYMVTFDDEIAHERDQIIDRVVAELTRTDGVGRAYREDREVLLVAAPALAADQIEGLLERIWQSLNT